MNDEKQVSVQVWDLPVRLVHWALVALLAFQAASGWIGGSLIGWHFVSGYCILALVLFRLLWGFAGSASARFAGFLVRPAAALGFAARLFSRRAEVHAGHNPLGGWMVVALLGAMLVQVGTGLFSNDGIANEGPLASLIPVELSDRVTTLHHWNFRILLLLALVHVGAVLYHWLVLGENLIGAMVTGTKRMRAAPAQAPLAFAGAWRAWLLLAIAIAAVWLLVARPF